MSSLGDVTLAYWDIRGLSSAIRLLLTYVGADWKSVTYTVKGEPGNWDKSEWENAKKELEKTNPLANLPWLQHKGQLITQSNAILAYLGRELNLNGSDDRAVTRNDQILNQIADLHQSMTTLAYDADDFEKEAKEYIKEDGEMHEHLSKLEKWLGVNKTEYIADQSPTTADFHAYEMLYAHLKLSPSCLDKYPNLKAYYGRISSQPKVQEYEASEFGQMPFNNKMAKWGSALKPPVSVE